MKVKEIMHRATFVDPEVTAKEAAKIMEDKNISSVIVGTPEDTIGMFTERDMLREVVGKGFDPSKAKLIDIMCSKELKDIMCRVITTVSEDAEIAEAAERMMGRYVRHLPVVDGSGKIIGMVSARTIMNALKYAYMRSKK